MLNTKLHCNRPSGSGGEDFLNVFTIYGHDLHFGKVTRPKHLYKGQGSRRVKIGPVTKINEIWLYCMCMSSVTKNDSF